MKGVLILTCLLAVAHHATAQCGSIQSYTETLIPQCATRDIKIKWPNYKNQATYYRCDGVNRPVQVTCPSGEYFAYVLQTCVTCDKYIPPVHCSQLKTQYTPNCVPIGERSSTYSTPSSLGSPYPTPNYSSSGSSQTSTPVPVATEGSTNADTLVTAQSTVNQTGSSIVPSPSVVSSTVAPLPSPNTNNPDVPMTSTPQPTPSNVSEYPQSIVT